MSGTGFEYWIARVPSWVVPGPMAVRDLTLLAGHLYRDKPTEPLHGVTATLAWVLGDAHGPITGRTEQPVTRQLAEAEEMASAIAAGPLFDLGPDYARLGVANVPTQPHAAGYCRIVGRTLRWLCGHHDTPAPLTIPERDADGQTLDAQALYDRRMADPYTRARCNVAEEQDALYAKCGVDAIHYFRLAQLLDTLVAH